MPCNGAWRVAPDQIMAASRYQSSLLKCHSCNARGVITWQAEGDEAPKTLVSVAGQFHVETGRTKPGGKVIVCSQCDEIHDVLPID